MFNDDVSFMLFLPDKSNPDIHCRVLECFVKVMCEDTTLKCTILTSLENKKNMENKKKSRPHAP